MLSPAHYFDYQSYRKATVTFFREEHSGFKREVNFSLLEPERSSFNNATVVFPFLHNFKDFMKSV